MLTMTQYINSDLQQEKDIIKISGGWGSLAQMVPKSFLMYTLGCEFRSWNAAYLLTSFDDVMIQLTGFVSDLVSTLVYSFGQLDLLVTWLVQSCFMHCNYYY